MQLSEARDAKNPERQAGQPAVPPRIRGWLLVYTVALAVFVLHAAELTVGSIVAYTHPAVAGSRSYVSLGFLLYYDLTNVALILYGVVLFILMARRRRSAIINNVIINILSVVFLLSWHLVGEKSNIGTVVDAVPNLVAAVYILLSKRVRNTFIVGRAP